MDRRISSICRSEGWWAGYAGAKGDADPYFHRVVAFVVVEDPEGSSVRAVDTLDILEGHGAVASDAHNFRGVFHESEFEILGEVLNVKGQDRFDRESP